LYNTSPRKSRENRIFYLYFCLGLFFFTKL
jgi:hypothetical protein